MKSMKCIKLESCLVDPSIFHGGNHGEIHDFHHFSMVKSDKSTIFLHFSPRNSPPHRPSWPGSAGTSWRPSSTAQAVGMRTTSPPGCSGTTSRRKDGLEDMENIWKTYGKHMEKIDNPKFGDSTLTLGFKVYFSTWSGGVLWEAGCRKFR